MFRVTYVETVRKNYIVFDHSINSGINQKILCVHNLNPPHLYSCLLDILRKVETLKFTLQDVLLFILTGDVPG